MRNPDRVMDAPRAFLSALWGNPPPGNVLVWTLPDKTSHWYAEFDHIDQYLASHPDKDIYMGVGLAPKSGVALTPSKRITENIVVGIPALWADLDVSHPVHKKAAYLPPTMDQALKALEQLPLRPTFTVDSGHGVQCWWVLDQPWLFDTPDERDQVRRATQWWHQMIKDIFREHNWSVDSTFDLARVMRIPGTWNNKEPQDRRQVILLEDTGERYRKEQFTELIPGDFVGSLPASPKSKRSSSKRSSSKLSSSKRSSSKGSKSGQETGGVTATGLVLNPEAEPPHLQMEALLKSNPKFRVTWEMKRSDLEDSSPSGYDMSLANFGVAAGFRDQVVVDLMIAFRRRHNLTPKLRADYYLRTLEKAKAEFTKARAEFTRTRVVAEQSARMADTEGDFGSGPNGEDGDDDVQRRAEAMESLRVIFPWFVIRSISIFSSSTKTSLVMETNSGTVRLHCIQDLLVQSRFIERIAEGIHKVPDLKFKTSAWRTVAHLILDAGVPQDMGALSSPQSECDAWIGMYLLNNTIVTDPDDAAAEHRPLLFESHLHLNLWHCREWLRRQLGVSLPEHELVERLHLCGWEEWRKNVLIGGERTTYRAWRRSASQET